MDALAQPGSYALLLQLEVPSRIEVGRLGRFAFPWGYYLYVGSARRGLLPRLRRHLRSPKPRHWHIDYLREAAEALEAWCVFSEERLECVLAEAARRQAGGQELAPGFGASDCSCSSHLTYFTQPPSFKAFTEELARQWPGASLVDFGEADCDEARIRFKMVRLHAEPQP